MKFLTTGMLWTAGEPDAYGQPTFGSPVPVRHRWEDRTGMFINNQGRQEGFKHRVYLNKPVKPGDRIAKSVSSTFADSIEIKDARQIMSVNGKKSEIRVLL